MNRKDFLIILCALGFGSRIGFSADVSFAPRELFRIPFGKSRETLAARVQGADFIIPRDFTMDGAGHFYIYDSNNHRIARYSSQGKYEIGFRYPETAKQIFAHADSHENLWLLVSDPVQGTYYGVSDAQGKNLRTAIFSRFDHFNLHLDDDATLHVILTSDKDKSARQTYVMDEETLLMKKENIARPPEDHHQIRRNNRKYSIDQVPDGSKTNADHVNQITDESHKHVADIKGSVIYVTNQGDVYTRVGERELRVYDVDGSLKGKIRLKGLASSCESIRFDSEGNIYQLDGIPDDKGQYDGQMKGMRLILWERR
jgi:hypothetical protein